VEVVRRADVLSLHCPLTRENRNLIDREMLALMPRGSILVNTARGGLVDDVALVTALKTGQLRAAGLDTFGAEPPPTDLPFRGVPGAIMTPHIGGVSSDAYRSMGTEAARNVLAVLTETEETQ
jgi:D-3-phosphoglycerate dehydrogenase